MYYSLISLLHSHPRTQHGLLRLGPTKASFEREMLQIMEVKYFSYKAKIIKQKEGLTHDNTVLIKFLPLCNQGQFIKKHNRRIPKH